MSSSSSSSSLSSISSAKNGSSAKKVTGKNAPRRNGFHYTLTYQDDKFIAALLAAKFRWAHAFSMDGGAVLETLKEHGKHYLLLVKGEIDAENVSRAWSKPLQAKIQTLEADEGGQKLLGPIRRNGTYRLTVVVDSVFYEAHLCLSPQLAATMVQSDELEFLVNDVPVSKAAALGVLNQTEFEATSKRCVVAVPGAATSRNARLVQKWFEDEWAAKSYNSRNAASTRQKMNVEGLYEYDDDLSEEESEVGGSDGDSFEGEADAANAAAGGDS